jgi:hypothetical protein
MDKRKGIKNDFSNLTIGAIYIESFTGEYGASGSNWNSKCVCGNKLIVSSRTIRRAIDKNYAISCGKCDAAIRKVNILPDEIAFNNLYSMYSSSAKTRNYCFELSKSDFKELTKGNCFYCGVEPKQIAKNTAKNTSNKGYYLYNGIDRKDVNFGYVKDNCVSACGVCNIMKQSMTVDEFIKQINTIHDYFKK